MRRRGIWLLVAALPFLMGANCDEDHDHARTADLPPGNFPSVETWWNAHNTHNADGQGFSPDGQDVEEVAWFANGGDPGTGILLFTTDPNPTAFDDSDSDSDGGGGVDDDGGDGDILWATFHRNGSFTPPVEIFAENQDDRSEVLLGPACALWLNDPVNRDREGDAIVTYARRSHGAPDDVDDSGVAEDEGNTRLYSFYFDVSESGRAVGQALDGSSMLYGFSGLATFVDDDPSGDDDDQDPDVESFVFVSDGLSFSAEVGPVDDDSDSDLAGTCRSGDPVNFVWAVWTQVAETGNQTADSPVERRVWHSQFDLSGTTTRFNPADADFVSQAPAGVTMEDEDRAGTQLLVHNGALIWHLDTDPSDPASNDQFLVASTFSQTGVSAPLLLSRQDEDTADFVTPAQGLEAKNLYGGDHGLTRTVLFFEESGFDEGNTSSARDLLVASIDLDGSDVENREIDEFQIAADETAVSFGSSCSAITRGGGHLVVSWRQPHLTLDEEFATNVSSTSSMYVRVIGDDFLESGLDFAVSGGPGDHTAVRLNADVLDSGTDEQSRDVREFAFQKDLADGTSDPDAVFQSNRFSVNFVFTQDMADAGAEGEVDLVALHTARVTIDPADVDNITATDTLVDTVDQDWADQSGYFSLPRMAQALDDGDGDVIVYYLNQGNNKDDEGSNGEDPTTVVGVVLDFDVGPFPAGEFIELSRLDLNTLGSGPECPPIGTLHVHAIDAPVGITIDGLGPFPEPPARALACGYGLLDARDLGGGGGTAAFPESRLYAWRQGHGPLEISSDGDSFGTNTVSPDFFQVVAFDTAQTPCNDDTFGAPDAGPAAHHVFISEL
ncbi:MAG: hypothetical protein ACYS0K_14640, partial [Planctomycetota bacterium]